MSEKKTNIAIIGGGAAGYFLAANLPESKNYTVTIFEQSKEPLQKVRISGGGRCNVSHACFDPKELVKNYPRGSKELLSVFNKFQPGDTMEWFETRNVPLKIEDDNRIFPSSDSSMSIINCLTNEVINNKTKVQLNTTIVGIKRLNNGTFSITTTTQDILFFDKLIITAGSSNKMWQMIAQLAHTIVPPVPSLFTFNCKDKRIDGLMGISFDQVVVKIIDSNFESEGPLLITHWGFSGPAILKLSAWAARHLAKDKYNFKIKINWINECFDDSLSQLIEFKTSTPKQKLYANAKFGVTKRFWQKILNILNISENLTFADASKIQLTQIANQLTQSNYTITGKSTFKDEFVTSGGVDLTEIDFRTMQSKIHQNLYFAGEVLDIDAITGGFNFQAAWSQAYIVSKQLLD